MTFIDNHHVNHIPFAMEHFAPQKEKKNGKRKMNKSIFMEMDEFKELKLQIIKWRNRFATFNWNYAFRLIRWHFTKWISKRAFTHIALNLCYTFFIPLDKSALFTARRMNKYLIVFPESECNESQKRLLIPAEYHRILLF